MNFIWVCLFLRAHQPKWVVFCWFRFKATEKGVVSQKDPLRGLPAGGRHTSGLPPAAVGPTARGAGERPTKSNCLGVDEIQRSVL